MTPAAILAKALERVDFPARDELARRAGLTRATLGRAAGKRPIAADHLLRLCAVIGIDPISGYARAPIENPGATFDRNSLAIAIRMNLGIRKHTIRQAADSVDVSATVFHRLMNEEVVAIESLLAGCRYVGIHPFSYLVVPADVSRKTVTGTSAVA